MNSSQIYGDAMSTGLLKPFNLGGMSLANRMVMAPLTRCRAAQGAIPGSWAATYYAQRASVGLIISEATIISPYAIGFSGVPGLYNQAQIEGWKVVTQAVHQAQGHIYAQLWHVGRASHPDFQPGATAPVAPSPIPISGTIRTPDGRQPYVTPRALATEEVPGIVEEYRQAALNALRAGFDGVEIHAANGYLIDQFLRDGSNRRDDIYGGSVPNRLRFLLEIVEAISTVVEPARIGVRVSPAGAFNDMRDSDPQLLFDAVAGSLAGRGLAYLHVIERFREQADAPFNFVRIKRLFDGVYIANGEYTLEMAQDALTQQRADLISFGRLMIANADLVERFRLKAELNIPDESTFYTGGSHGYIDYPKLEG